jgi:hypothetical protein
MIISAKVSLYELGRLLTANLEKDYKRTEFVTSLL